MSERVKEYLDAVRNNPGHKNALRSAHEHGKADESIGAVVSHAARLGFHFTREELLHFITGDTGGKGSKGRP